MKNLTNKSLNMFIYLCISYGLEIFFLPYQFAENKHSRCQDACMPPHIWWIGGGEKTRKMKRASTKKTFYLLLASYSLHLSFTYFVIFAHFLGPYYHLKCSNLCLALSGMTKQPCLETKLEWKITAKISCPTEWNPEIMKVWIGAQLCLYVN